MSKAERMTASDSGSPVDFAELVACHLAGELEEAGQQRLSTELAAAPERRAEFVAMCLHAQLVATCVGLEFADEAFVDDVEDAENADFDATPLAPAPTAVHGFLGNMWHGTIGFFSQEIPFSLLIATVITSLGLWAGSMVYVSAPEHIAKDPQLPKKSEFAVAKSHTQYVGRITGRINVQWSDPTQANVPERVALGGKYALASGLLEITYDTGAKVILQGPCTYQADSRDGGFLSLGKLTAKLEKKGSEVRGQGSEKVASGQSLVVGGHWSVASETDPEIPKSQIPNPSSSPAHAFAVRTPTATVTDLGTEFGVSVANDKSVEVQVFRGLVDVQRQDIAGAAQTIVYRLKASEGLNIKHGVAQVSRMTVNRSRFPVIHRDHSQKLAARYQFDEIHESTSHAQWILDNSGHRLLGALQNTTHANLVPGISGKALELNVGKDELHQCVTIPWSPSFDLKDDSFTIAMWLQRKVAGVEMHEIILTQENWAMPSGGYAIVRDQQSKKLGFRILHSQENAAECFNAWVKTDTPSDKDDAPIGKWVYFVVVGRRSPASGLFDIQLYHNGIPAGIQKNVEMTTSRATLRFCAQETDAWAFRGLLDDVQIYHRALNDQDVKYLYEHPGSLSPMADEDSN